MTGRPVIAVVDDDAAIRSGLSSLLRSAGYSVELFDSAESFLDAAADARAAAVITDIQMGEMSGLHLQGWLRENRPRLPLLVMTAYPEPRFRAQALAAGALCFLSKPFDAGELLACVDRALGG